MIKLTRIPGLPNGPDRFSHALRFVLTIEGFPKITLSAASVRQLEDDAHIALETDRLLATATRRSTRLASDE